MQKLIKRPLTACKRTYPHSQKVNTRPATNLTKATGRLISIARKLVTTILFMTQAVHTAEEQSGHGLLLEKSIPAAPNTITISITGMPVEEALKVKFSLQPGKFKQTTSTVMINIAGVQENVTIHPKPITIKIEGIAPNDTGIPLSGPVVEIKKPKKRSLGNDQGRFHRPVAKPDRPKMISMRCG